MKQVIDIAIMVVLLTVIFLITWKYRSPGACIIDPTLEKLRRDLIKVDPRLGALQYFPSTESYTEDKQRIYICMKDEHGNYYPYNTLLAVCLHEAAHALTHVIDTEHTSTEFNAMHEALRKKATDLGIFDPTKAVPTGYCPKT